MSSLRNYLIELYAYKGDKKFGYYETIAGGAGGNQLSFIIYSS
jgi:N-methylhydantoinase B/oxoprolinase/acetone carboxylase alpha subunit